MCERRNLFYKSFGKEFDDDCNDYEEEDLEANYQPYENFNEVAYLFF